MNAMSKVENGPKAETAEPEIKATLAEDPVRVEPVSPTPAPVKAKRRGGRFALMLLVPLALAGVGGWYWVTGGRIQETDNANLRQARVTISSEAAGRIVELDIHDNMQVKAGDKLFVVDPEPYRIALAQADAALATARLNVEQLRARWSEATAQDRVAAGEVSYFQSELDRQTSLTGKGVGTKSALDSSRRDLSKAQEQKTVAAESVIGALAALGGDANVETDAHPAVLSALAARDKAAYQLSQTTVRAPADGIVSQAASFKMGQFVGVGTPLFSLVETGDVWVEANFKETQLTNMKLGQEADVTLDTFPDRPLKATVESIGAGTGAEFSLLPAQNATGNWVKVTQRIPVRLKITGDDANLLLRTGMSATVEVDTGVSRGLPSLFGKSLAGEAK